MHIEFIILTMHVSSYQRINILSRKKRNFYQRDLHSIICWYMEDLARFGVIDCKYTIIPKNSNWGFWA